MQVVGNFGQRSNALTGIEQQVLHLKADVVFLQDFAQLRLAIGLATGVSDAVGLRKLVVEPM
ncbi:hypothetical protein D3C78_1886140 [compost metagenome]